MDSASIPYPPVELRRTVGLETTELFDNPHGVLAFGPNIPGMNYQRVLDFGCGCGRNARQMMLQRESIPQRYLGLDLYRPSIEWCKANLTRAGFEFRHLDVFNAGLNPSGRREVDFGVDEDFTLINAHSVFTHILEPNIEFYFEQCARRLSNDGIMRTTWFLFDKINFPMMQEFQNCLYINPDDPTNATIYDVAFVRQLFARHGLTIFVANAPRIRGFQWEIFARVGAEQHVEFAPDLAPTGLARPPVTIHD